MPNFDPAKIEARIDKTVAAEQEIQMALGGVQFRTMIEVMEFAKCMATSDLAVPPHLRGNVGACLAICTKALRFNFDPFSLAEHSFAMSKEVEVTVNHATGGRSASKEKVQTIAYDSYVIRAIINAHAPIKGGLKYAYSGDGDSRKCTVKAERSDTGEVIEHASPTLQERVAAIGKNADGKVKGSPLWTSKPDVQLGYDTARDLCRLHFPEILMGWYDKDEMTEAARAEAATDITPRKPSAIKERLQGQKGQRGFHASNTAALSASTEMPIDTSVGSRAEPEPVVVETPLAPTEIISTNPVGLPGDAPAGTAEALEAEYLPFKIEQLSTAEGDELEALDKDVRKVLAAHANLIGVWNGHFLSRRRALGSLKATRTTTAVVE